MKTISILCPTRQRAVRAKGYALSAFAAAKFPDRVELLFYVDEDDPELGIYKSTNWSSIGDITITIGPSISISKSWNVIAEKSTGDILLMGNDDLIHETIGWDVVLEETSLKYPDDIYCIFFDDGINEGNHCAFPGLSRKWFNILGYFTPGIFEFLYNDTWIFEVAKKLNRLEYVSKIMVRHHHWSRTGIQDETTKRHRLGKSAGRIKKDKDLFFRTDTQREEAANLLRRHMHGYVPLP